ncbi:hypothetical protein JOQ06_019183, partial [Pogonophryne albipinna]
GRGLHVHATADRARCHMLEAISEEQHEQWTPPPMCTLHWDSKLTPMLTNVRQLEERLTVVVGEVERLKLLGVPAYMKGTDEPCGMIIARLTCKLLQGWCCTIRLSTWHLTPPRQTLHPALSSSSHWVDHCSGPGAGTTSARCSSPTFSLTSRWRRHARQRLHCLHGSGTTGTWCHIRTAANWNDLTLYHHLNVYKSVDEGIAASAIKALEWHLWYLTGEMLPLALFSTKVPVGERCALADAILKHKPADIP